MFLSKGNVDGNEIVLMPSRLVALVVFEDTITSNVFGEQQ